MKIKTEKNIVCNRVKYPFQSDSKKGFTLIETLLYVSILSILLLSVSIFLSILLEAKIKNQTIAEVEQQGTQVMQIITQTIRNAQSITSPTQGNSAQALTLQMPTVAKNPTLFDLAANVIRITEGAEPAISLTSSRLTTSNLIFRNLSKNNTPGTIQIEFTLTHVNPSGRNEYNFSKTFYGSASIR